ncbi:hypothetical protein OROMI_004369 [Orobanche minor]
MKHLLHLQMLGREVSRVIDSFGKSIVLDCFKIQNLLLGLKKCNTEGRYKIRAARFIKGIVTAPILFAIEEFPELRPIIDRGFDKPGDVDLGLQRYLPKLYAISEKQFGVYSHLYFTSG